MKTLLVAMLLSLGILLGGCTMTETPTERNQRIVRGADIQSREMVEDWDVFWLVDRPTYLSPWYVRTGLPY
jgi:hypothetical protein